MVIVEEQNQCGGFSSVWLMVNQVSWHWARHRIHANVLIWENNARGGGGGEGVGGGRRRKEVVDCSLTISVYFWPGLETICHLILFLFYDEQRCCAFQLPHSVRDRVLHLIPQQHNLLQPLQVTIVTEEVQQYLHSSVGLYHKSILLFVSIDASRKEHTRSIPL